MSVFLQLLSRLWNSRLHYIHLDVCCRRRSSISKCVLYVFLLISSHYALFATQNCSTARASFIKNTSKGCWEFSEHRPITAAQQSLMSEVGPRWPSPPLCLPPHTSYNPDTSIRRVPNKSNLTEAAKRLLCPFRRKVGVHVHKDTCITTVGAAPRYKAG